MSNIKKVKIADTTYDIDAKTVDGHSVEGTGIASNTTTIPTTAQVKVYVDANAGSNKVDKTSNEAISIASINPSGDSSVTLIAANEGKLVVDDSESGNLQFFDKHNGNYRELLCVNEADAVLRNGSGSEVYCQSDGELDISAAGNLVLESQDGGTSIISSEDITLRSYNSESGRQGELVIADNNDDHGKLYFYDYQGTSNTRQLLFSVDGNDIIYKGQSLSIAKEVKSIASSVSPDDFLGNFKIATVGEDDAPYDSDGILINIPYGNGQNYGRQFYLDDESNVIYTRYYTDGNDFGSWQQIPVGSSGGGSVSGNYLPLTGGNVSGHIYMTGANATSSTNNTSQIVFGTSSNNHVAISSDQGTLIVNPSVNSTTGQIELHVGSNPSIAINGDSVITSVGASPNCGDGTTITQPGGEAAISIRTSTGASRDVGIFRLTQDNAYICNSADNGYNFAVFDTDLTTDFSSNSNASFVVLESGAGLKARGSYVLVPVLLWSGSATNATVSSDFTHYIVTVNYGLASFGSIIVKKRTTVRSAMITAYSSAEVDFFNVEVSTAKSGSSEKITATGHSNYIFSSSFSNDSREMSIKEIYGIKIG